MGAGFATSSVKVLDLKNHKLYLKPRFQVGVLSRFMSATPGLELGDQRDLLMAFADEYAAAGGPTLDVDELKLRFDLSLALSLGGQLGVVPMLYRGIPKDQWPTVASWRDGRIDADTGLAMLTRSYLCNLVYRMTRWKHDGVYARVCEWAGVAQAPGT